MSGRGSGTATRMADLGTDNTTEIFLPMGSALARCNIVCTVLCPLHAFEVSLIGRFSGAPRG